MRLSSKQAEHDSVHERLTNSDMMVSDDNICEEFEKIIEFFLQYAELCSQLAAALQYEENDSTDIDFLISQVSLQHPCLAYF